MNLREARKNFNTEIKPEVVKRYGPKDTPALNEAWGIYIDDLCKNGTITEKQYMTWTRD